MDIERAFKSLGSENRANGAQPERAGGKWPAAAGRRGRGSGERLRLNGCVERGGARCVGSEESEVGGREAGRRVCGVGRGDVGVKRGKWGVASAAVHGA